MFASGESQKEVIRPVFNRAIMIDFQGAKITSDVRFPLVREIDDPFKIIDPMIDPMKDCWLGFIGLKSMRFLFTDGAVCPSSEKN